MINDYLDQMQILLDLIRQEVTPKPPTQVKVSTVEELQAAVDNLTNRDILVKPGHYSQLILRNGSHNLTIQPDTSNLPVGRVNPEFIEAMITVQSLKIEPTAEGYYLRGFNVLPGVRSNPIISLGSDTATDPLNTPNKICFDQFIVSADPEKGGKRGIMANCREFIMLNSHMDHFWYDSDSQCISGWNGPGPHKIQNCYLVASGENFMLGGADAKNEEMIPRNLIFIGNHCTKPIEWKTKAATTVKNSFELKACIGGLIQGNLFEHSWTDGQTGYLMLITPRNQGGTAPFTVVKDILVNWNVFRNAGAGIMIIGDDNIHPTQRTSGLVIEDNLMYNIDIATHAGAGRLLAISRGLLDSSIKRNTLVGKKMNSFLTLDGPNQSERITMQDNIVSEGPYGLFGSGGLGLTGWNALVKDGLFSGNVVIPGGARNINYGPDNLKVASAIDDSYRSLLFGKGVNLDELRKRVQF